MATEVKRKTVFNHLAKIARAAGHDVYDTDHFLMKGRNVHYYSVAPKEYVQLRYIAHPDTGIKKIWAARLSRDGAWTDLGVRYTSGDISTVIEGA
jgi:hypothetical protein